MNHTIKKEQRFFFSRRVKKKQLMIKRDHVILNPSKMLRISFSLFLFYAMEDNTVSHFVVLFTAQKARKNKIWQDGFLKYYSFNKKLVLIDEKGYNIDRKFNKGGRPAVGDELEFDGHIVTIEEYQSTEIANVNQPSRVNVNQPSRVNVSLPDRQLNKEPPKENVQKQSKNAPFKPPSFVPKKRMIKSDSEEEDPMDIDDKPTLPSSSIPTSSTAVTPPVQPTPAQPTPIGSSSCVPLKRARMGLSKKTTSVLHQHIAQQTTPPPQQTSFQPASSMTAQATTNTPKHASTETPKVSPEQTISGHKDPTETKYTSMILQFPNSRKALGLVKSKNYPKRSKVVPAKFKNPALYQNTFRAIINEHLDILLLNYGMYFHSVYEKLGKNKHGQDLERTMRSKGIAIYVQNELKQENPRYGQSTFRLMLRSNREHHSKYNRDDIWIISNVPSFESSQTFLARSTFFGPFSDGSLELHCLSARDARVASQVMKKETSVYALRTISASTEFMMLDTLDQQLHELPVLPYLLSNPRLSKKAKPLPTLEHIRLTQHDHVDIEARIRETIQYHKLNADQEAVLRQVAKSVIYCPGWNEQLEQPIVLVHGVYGSGKSFLAAVIIIFLQDLIDTVNGKREPEDAISFKILVSSMTNVAVDRILQTLLKLGYDHFIRIGSMKKIAKNLLPFTAKARASSNEGIGTNA
ncbi:uncharacterized protein B0P05DRAFT_285529 [Gilbertella persicaria]|uniref:uncharacterized protein n=1 Tax=Gilbertella persicaria TaxID=101096 RepID=UPI002220776B|nr:uncharacterized protein B0P05DRAFT_285529 [Gilbertella persicaria]KAI8056283.1 hypothetical protein B0P05DRAFT_285529 [Gilbertella persicaria]